MLKREEVSITEEYGNQVAPYQYRITHVPSGVFVIGNTGSEAGKPRLQADLLANLERAIQDWEPPKAKTQADEIAELQARLEQLLGANKPAKTPAKYKDEAVTSAAPKRRGRPPKVKAGEIPTHPEGYSVLDPSKVALPPSVQVFETRVFKPATTVSVVSDKAAAKGIQA